MVWLEDIFVVKKQNLSLTLPSLFIGPTKAWVVLVNIVISHGKIAYNDMQLRPLLHQTIVLMFVKDHMTNPT